MPTTRRRHRVHTAREHMPTRTLATTADSLTAAPSTGEVFCLWYWGVDRGACRPLRCLNSGVGCATCTLSARGQARQRVHPPRLHTFLLATTVSSRAQLLPDGPPLHWTHPLFSHLSTSFYDSPVPHLPLPKTRRRHVLRSSKRVKGNESRCAPPTSTDMQQPLVLLTITGWQAHSSLIDLSGLTCDFDPLTFFMWF